MARTKAPALVVPLSLAEATDLTAQYVKAERWAMQVRLETEQLIDRVKANRDQTIAAITAHQVSRFAALKAWWEAGGRDLAGKRRSAELAGATLGVRLSTPKVKFAKGTTAELLIDWLGRVVGGSGYLRQKVELDKLAIIKALSEDAPLAGPLGEQGVSLTQSDEFFIDSGLDAPAVAKEVLR